MSRIGVFGGAFDPPHVAHLMSVTQVLAVAGLDRVLVVPCWGHGFGKPMSPFEDRLAMTRLAFGQFDPNRVMVSDIERDLQTRYTIDLVANLKIRLFDCDLVLIMGEDEWRARERWHRWTDLAAMVPVTVVGREDGAGDVGCDVRLPDVSSTFIRATIARHGPDLCRNFVPAAALDYIREKGLYKAG